jgi:hypothetical protein
LLVFGQLAGDGKASAAQVDRLKELKEICRRERFTIREFVTDRIAGDDALHEEQHGLNMRAFIENPSAIPLKQHSDPISDVLDLFKRALSQKVRLGPLVLLLADNLSPIVFSDDDSDDISVSEDGS